MFGIQGLQFWHCLVVLAILAYVWISIESIPANEAGVVTFGGNPTSVVTSGFHFVPAFFCSVIKYPTERQSIRFFVPVLTSPTGGKVTKSDIGIEAKVEVYVEFDYPVQSGNNDLFHTAREISDTSDEALETKFRAPVGDVVQAICGKFDWKELKRVREDLGKGVMKGYNELPVNRNALAKARLENIDIRLLEVVIDPALAASLARIETSKNEAEAEAIRITRTEQARAGARKMHAVARRQENAARLGMDPEGSIEIDPENAILAEQLRVGQGLAEGDNNWVVSAPELGSFLGALTGIAQPASVAVKNTPTTKGDTDDGKSSPDVDSDPDEDEGDSNPTPDPKDGGKGEDDPAPVPSPVPDDEDERDNGW